MTLLKIFGILLLHVGSGQFWQIPLGSFKTERARWHRSIGDFRDTALYRFHKSNNFRSHTPLLPYATFTSGFRMLYCRKV